jgi:hypothetical protein
LPRISLADHANDAGIGALIGAWRMHRKSMAGSWRMHPCADERTAKNGQKKLQCDV